MTLQDFRLLVARISLAAPMRPALSAVKLPVQGAKRVEQTCKPVLRANPQSA